MSWLKNFAGNLQNEVAKYQNRPFMEAVVAACAIVATADGKVSPEEKTKMGQFIQSSKEMRVFKTSEVLAFFDEIMQPFAFDFEFGKQNALNFVGKVPAGSDAAKMVVLVCRAIAMSDGDFSEDEKNAVRSICVRLGFAATDFNL